MSGVRFRLEPSSVREYVAAVGDRSDLYRTSPLVPPTALAALGVRAMLEGLGLPPGAIHVAQELTMRRAVKCGEEVQCQVRVAQSSQRREWQVVVLEFTLADIRGAPVLEGRSTLLIPVAGRGPGP